MTTRRGFAIGLLLAAVIAPRVHAEENPPEVTDGHVEVKAGSQYDVGSVRRAFFGNGWRPVWTTPVRVPVFDMSDFAGGVEPTERGSGNQTKSLRFREIGGWREYQFRSVNKDPVTLAMPKAVRGTTLGSIVQDMTSAQFPAAGLMMPPLLDAIGVLHVTPELYVMPDDPRLGEHRKEFAGMLGTVELSPDEAPDDQPGFADSRRIVSGEDFLDEVIGESHENHVDEREFFAMRLVDFLVNDNDRTPDNIRFARYGEEGAYQWRPIPRDRDRAFIDARGWVTKDLVRPVYPKLVKFDPKVSLRGLTYESTQLDRRLLQSLTRSDAEEIAQRVQLAMDDATLEKALAGLPPEWSEQSVDRLRTVLRARRDAIPAIAQEFYGWLATDVDVHGTEEVDRAVVTRHDDGSVTVTVTGGEKDSLSAEPFSQRTFLPDETGEIRLYLHDGDDSVLVAGASNDEIKVRVIGGDGDDSYADSAGGATLFYDTKIDDEFLDNGGKHISLERWDEPRRGAGVRLDAPWRPDWGSKLRWWPAFGHGHGSGVIVGFGPRFTSHGFRRLPYKWKASANVLVGVANEQPGANARVEYRAENSPLSLTLDARATKFEEFRFHGFGNDVPEVDKAVSEVEQDVIAVQPSLVWEIGWRDRENLGSGFSDEDDVLPGLRPLVGHVEAGPIVLWNKLHPPLDSPLRDEGLPGTKDIGRAGARIGLALDRTSAGAVSDAGWRASAELAAYPPMWDIDRSFSTASATLATYVPLPGEGVHFGVRASGEMASGGFPVQDGPAIGGRRTVRGISYHRYRGDTSASGSVELRVPTGMTVPIFIKWDVGVFGLADAGRVWFDSRSEGDWHSSVGGGIWLASLGQIFSLAYAHGDEHHFYIRRGLSF